MGLPAADIVIGPMTPLPLTAARISLAATILLPLWLAVDGWETLKNANWRQGFLIGGMGFGLGAWLMLVGQALTDVVTIAIISATMPVIGIAFEWLTGGRKLTLMLGLGLVFSLAGGFLAVGAGASGVKLWSLGTLAAFGSVLAYTWGSFATVRTLPGLGTIGQTAITLTAAAVITTLAAIIQAASGGPSPNWAAMGGPQIAALAFYAIGGMALSQLLWIASIGRLGVGIGSMHINASPFYVMAIAYALGGTWNGWQAFSAVVVAAGVLIAQISPARGRT